MKFSRWLRENELLVVSAVTLLALGLRLVNLDVVFWQDEALYVFASQNLSGFLGTYPSGFALVAHPPLYTYLLALLGLLPWTSEMFFRSLSVVAGTATVPVVYLLGRRFYDEAAGLLAALLLAFSTNHIIFSQDVHPGTVAVFLSSVAVLSWLRFLEEGGMAPAVTASFLAVFSHFINYFLFLFLPVLQFLRGRSPDRREIVFYTLFVLTGAGLFLFMFNQVFVPKIYPGTTANFQGEISSGLPGALEALTGLVVMFLNAPWAQTIQTVLGIFNSYWGSAYLYLPLILLAVPLVKLDESSKVLYSWFLSVFAVVLAVSGLMVSAGYGPGRAYPLLIPPILLLNARGIQILAGRRRLLGGIALLLLGVFMLHLPQVYGSWSQPEMEFRGGWYPHFGGVKPVFQDASVVYRDEGEAVFSFQARSADGSREMKLSTGNVSRSYKLGPVFSNYSFSFEAGGGGRISVEVSGNCTVPVNGSWCRRAEFRGMELVTDHSLSTVSKCDYPLCLRENPVGADPDRNWRPVSRSLANSSGEIYASYPAIAIYYSGLETERFRSLRWNPDHSATNLESSFGKEFWVVTDRPHFLWQFNSRERRYLSDRCGFSETGKVWLFHCPAG